VRLTNNGTEVCWLPPNFSAKVPHVAALDGIVANSGGHLNYQRAVELLTVNGKLDERSYRALLAAYGGHAARAAAEAALRSLKDRSSLYISDEDLRSLETFARRIRGEIFFARRWMLVEGQGEYLIVHATARRLGYDLDEHGVSVIDSQNNGNPAIFAALARALSIPWLAIFDGDQAGQEFCQAIRNRGFSAGEVNARCQRLSAGNLEQQLLADGLEQELKAALVASGHADAPGLARPDLLARLDKCKGAYAAALAMEIAADDALANRMPEAFRSAISALRGLA
jgi:putative ATP-dependent endonuclease of OLD family